MQKILTIIAFSLVHTNYCFAKSEIKITTSEQIDLIKKEWECDWKSTAWPEIFSGKYLLSIETISGNSVSGKFNNTFCPGEQELRGEIKKGKFYWVVKKPPSPCEGGDIKANAKLIKDDGNNLILKGKFNGFAGFGTTTRISGPFECM